MTEQTLAYLLTLCGSIIIVLLGIIGFFLAKIYSKFEEMVISIFEIKERVSTNIGEVINLKTNCHLKHAEIHEKINTLEDRSFNHEKRITKLEVN